MAASARGQRLFLHGNVLPLSVGRIPDLKVGINPEAEWDSFGALLKLDEEGGVIPGARRDLNRIAKAGLEVRGRVHAQPERHRSTPIGAPIRNIRGSVEENERRLLAGESQRVTEPADAPRELHLTRFRQTWFGLGLPPEEGACRKTGSPAAKSALRPESNEA
jgi:hypothetical protein